MAWSDIIAMVERSGERAGRHLAEMRAKHRLNPVNIERARRMDEAAALTAYRRSNPSTGAEIQASINANGAEPIKQAAE